MHTIRKIAMIMTSILLLLGGWIVFNREIRPLHYQLLFPYSILHWKPLALTETRMGGDGRLQVRVPAGTAKLGKDETAAEIDVPEYWIDQTPVTLAAFKQYIEKTGALAPRYHDEYAKFWKEKRYELLPAVFVSWGQAEEYCEYYGGHLPTEAQWEKAARGPEGVILYWDDAEKAFHKANYDRFYEDKTPSGWLPAGKTVYGVLDMAGNVREWCLEWLPDLKGPIYTGDWRDMAEMKMKDTGRLLKGGGFNDDVSHLRFFSRDVHDPFSPGLNRGFRCVY